LDTYWQDLFLRQLVFNPRNHLAEVRNNAAKKIS